MTHDTAPRATFSHMEHGTREDWAAISAEFMPFARALPDRVLDRKSTRLNSSHIQKSRMPSSA